jgi:predicted transposase YbfD/YdcC
MPTTDVALARYFAALPDPRIDRTKKHLLVDIVVITICAVIAGADSWEEIAAFGQSKEAWLRRFLTLPEGIPSHDTFYRVFAALEPRAFQDCFGQWITAVSKVTGLKTIAVDGKAVRAARHATASGCLHLVNAWATQNHLILAQTAVATGSSEATALPELLRVLDLKGALVSLDAGGCHQEIAQQIRDQQGHYLLAVKRNQPKLYAAVEALFDPVRDGAPPVQPVTQHSQVAESHGRQEERYVTAMARPPGLPTGWPDVAAAVMVVRDRVAGTQRSCAAHYYLTSLKGTAKTLGTLIRGHWQIENGLHWVLDVAFREDQQRTQVGHAGANLSWVRRVALSLLKQAQAKGSVKGKRLRAGWDDDFLLQVLQGIPGN